MTIPHCAAQHRPFELQLCFHISTRKCNSSFCSSKYVLGPLLSPSAASVSALARGSEQDKTAKFIKYVTKYGTEVHQALADAGQCADPI